MFLYIEEVGMTGFEPATSRSQSECSTKLSYIPKWVKRGSNPRQPPCKGDTLPLSYSPDKTIIPK